MMIWTWCLQGLVSVLMSMVFGVLFQIPRRQLLFTGITGGSGWLCYSISLHGGLSPVAAFFLAAALLTAVARVFAYRRREPVPSFLVAGIFPIVPGLGIYNTGYQFFMGNNEAAAQIGVDTLKASLAIALGIGVVLSLPQIFFSFRRKGPEKKGPENSGKSSWRPMGKEAEGINGSDPGTIPAQEDSETIREEMHSSERDCDIEK